MGDDLAETAALSAGELRTELARIDYEVDSGDHDLAALGFWRLMGKVKRRPDLIEVAAEPAGGIDWKAFKAYTKLRLPVWFGNVVLLVGVGIGAVCILIAREATNTVVAGVALILAAGIWSVSVHSPTHWAVGRVVGIRFRCYFFGGPFPPRPGLKTDFASYLRTGPDARALMHASGALATKVAPFVALAFYPGSGAPGWAAALVLALGVVQILTDVFLSVKSSDWKKVKRETAVVRALKAGRS